MAAGRTRPLLLEAVRETTSSRRERGRFVTKAIGLPEVRPDSLAHEFLGARLAIVYGLAAPQAHLVSISDGFIAAAAADFAAAGLHVQSGVAVGTEFVPDLMPFPAGVQLADDEVLAAAEIFVFDLLTQNPDRSTTNPNCGRAAERLIPYDFETAFSFRLALSRDDAWRVGSLPFPRRHLFYASLTRARVDWHFIFDRLGAVPMDAVADACSTIPPEWRDAGIDVHRHLSSVHQNWPQFEQEAMQHLGGSR